MNRLFFIRVACLMVWGLICLPPSPGQGAEYLQVPGVIHVHSTFSSGRYSLPELTAMAESSGVEVLVITDHDWVVMEYGLPPLRRLIRVRRQRPAVLQTGVRDYLDRINDLNKLQKEVILIPGVQSSPFYYWSGNPFFGDLTAHDYRKELITVGLSSPEDFEGLPALHRIRFSGIPGDLLLIWIGAAMIVLLWTWWIRPWKAHKPGLVVAGTAALLLFNYHPFQGSGFDPYGGPRGEAPYQDYIDYVQARGGMTFWCHPESTYSSSGRPLGPIMMQTRPYPEALNRTVGYTGFAAIYGDKASAHRPGGHWDEALTEYCAGFRDKPVWAISEADYHGNRQGEVLGRYLTIFLVREKNRAQVLEAMDRGRMYAVLKQGAVRPVLEDFRITDPAGGRTAVSGQLLSSTVMAEISGRLSASDNQAYETELLIIKNGRVMRVINARTPFSFQVRDEEQTPGKSAYRLEANMKKAGKIISNPIFSARPG